MTIRFRVNEFRAHTTSGDATYSFPSPLTVLAGPVAVGKSTLFEAMKYALGCDALLSGVIRADVQSVSIDVSLGDERYSLKRLITTPEATTVDVYDVKRQNPLGPHSTKPGEEHSLNSLLLTALGLPDNMLAASSATGTTKKGSRVSFADVWKYLYVPQAEINQSVASSENTWYTPKRKAVFELLFDLTNPEILRSQSESAVARLRVEEVERSAQTVRQFLNDSRTPSRNELDVRRAEASQIRQEAATQLAEIRQGFAPAIDGETQVLRELLIQAEERLAEARSAAATTRQQLSDFYTERKAVQDDIERLSRMKMAGERIAQIEFVNCPRCMQSLKQRFVPDDHCPLCLQLDPVPHVDSGNLSAETTDLQSQLVELTNQTEALENELLSIESAAEDRSAMIYRLSEIIRDRTSDRITPELQAYADATSKVATTSVQLQEIEERLLQWDRADDLEKLLEDERAGLTRLETRTETLREAIADRKKEVLSELSEEYEATVKAIGVPGVVTATVDASSYLPLINGTQLAKLSPAGGLRTTAIVSYWVTLLTVALRRRDTLHPGFLLLDSPRTSLNDSDSIASALYRRLVTLADAADGRVQLIIGDNELPASYHRDYDQIDLSYASPAISTIDHPGVANVERLEG